MESKILKEILDNIVLKENNVEFISNDLVQFPRRFKKIQDIEISGFLISLISCGISTIIL